MAEWISPVATIVVGVVTALVGWVTTRAKAQSDQDLARGPEWGLFTDKIEQHFEALFRQERERTASVIKDLRDRVSALEAQAARVERERDLAVSHIRDWRALYPEGIPRLPPPTEIAHLF